jgi:hypothetical protein
MKNYVKALATVLACLSLVPAYAQMGGHPGGMGGPPHGPNFSGSMAKLFGNNSTFSARLEIQNEDITMPGKMAFDNGKARFEMDMMEMKGGHIPPEASAQMKAMGMDKMLTLSLPDRKATYIIYPGLQAYAEMPFKNPEDAKTASDFKIETTELGKETVDGHPCVKNKAVVTDDQGKKHESIVWNATDLKGFPVQIESTEQGRKTTMVFKDVKLSKPDASQFELPSDYKKYDTMAAMMQAEMMKRMGGGMGMPPQHP